MSKNTKTPYEMWRDSELIRFHFARPQDYETYLNAQELLRKSDKLKGVTKPPKKKGW